MNKPKKMETKVTEYLVSDDNGTDYIVTIIKGDEWYESWIRRPDYGIQLSMFDLPRETNTMKEFLEIVWYNLEIYMQSYDERIDVDYCFEDDDDEICCYCPNCGCGQKEREA